MSKKKRKKRPLIRQKQQRVMQQPSKRLDPKDIMKDPYFKKWLPTWHHNVVENCPQIKEDFQVDENWVSHNNICISSQINVNKNKPAIIIGSGPSLDRALPFLKNWNGAIFAATSNALSLVKHERDPDYINAFDSHWGLFAHVEGYEWKNTTLLTHPYAEPKTIKWWKWNKYYYRRYYVELEFSEVILPLLFPWIKIGIRVTGCVVNSNYSIASFWGFNPIFLVGVDFGWKNDDYHHSMYYRLTNGEWEEKPPRNPSTWPEEDRKKIIQYGDAKTKAVDIGFKNDLLRLWGNNPSNLIDCSDGVINELPKANIEEVIKKQGMGFESSFKTKSERAFILNKYFGKK